MPGQESIKETEAMPVSSAAAHGPGQSAAESPHFQTDEELYQQLCGWFKPFRRIYVAFSGGADSALVLRAALDGAGSSKVTAVTADSASLPRAELTEIKQLVEQYGALWTVLPTDELKNPQYRANAGDRCYFCKQTLYSRLEKLVDLQAGDIAVDGTNSSDLGDYRPGMRAAAEHKIRHPLVENGLNKQAVRRVSTMLGLSTADKPAMACLSSRIPAGTEVTAEKLALIEAAEAGLRKLGFKQLRVRYHELNGLDTKGGAGPALLARIELAADELARAAEPQIRSLICRALVRAGFGLVTLDLIGYKEAGRPAADHSIIALPGGSSKNTVIDPAAAEALE